MPAELVNFFGALGGLGAYLLALGPAAAWASGAAFAWTLARAKNQTALWEIGKALIAGTLAWATVAMLQALIAQGV
jgi:hypothetical protein